MIHESRGRFKNKRLRRAQRRYPPSTELRLINAAFKRDFDQRSNCDNLSMDVGGDEAGRDEEVFCKQIELINTRRGSKKREIEKKI